MTDQSTDTKEKIMESARILFANQGFEGTSVREIAKTAEVNIASLNYHFSSKENLFGAILDLGYSKCSNAMREMYDRDQPNLEETLIFLFRYFLSTSHDLVTYFKMMMSTQHAHHMVCRETGDQMIGPPGGQVIVEAILKDVQGNLSDEDLHWGLKSLFSSVVHTAIMYSCCFKHNSMPFTSQADLEKNIRRLTRVVAGELKSNKI